MGVKIKSLSTNAGFLEKCNIEFHDNLTCIIGARGTCKSTLIETIRFAFDLDEKVIEILCEQGDSGRSVADSRKGMIIKTLGAGTVKCEVFDNSTKDELNYTLERDTDSEVRIYREGVKEHVEKDLLNKIEIFSQGDLQKLAEEENNKLRIGLLDKINNKEIGILESERKEHSEKVYKLSCDIREYRSKIVILKQEVSPLEETMSAFKKLKAEFPDLPPELEENRVVYEKSKKVEILLNDALVLKNEVFNEWMDFEESIDELESIKKEIEGYGFLEAKGSQEVLSKICEDLNSIYSSINKFKEIDLEEPVKKLKEVFEEKNVSYYQQRKKEETINESLKKLDVLRDQIESLTKKQNELNDAIKVKESLEGKRSKHRKNISEIDSQVYELRNLEVDTINRDHSDKVLLALELRNESTEYYEKLNQMLSGSRVRVQNEIARDLNKNFSPSALIDIVESDGGQLLSDMLDRDLGQMNRIITHLTDRNDLYELEKIQPEMKLKISMFDKGEKKPVEELSKGQKATTFLPLILRDLPYPLLIDQPEDDLDNAFIMESLIDEIKKLKMKRQIIFVTHNANIPVLGEAEKVIVMDMISSNKAAMPLVGDVDSRRDEIVRILEGGDEAFKQRAIKYDFSIIDKGEK